ncbi:MAG TPA: cytochrome c [Candidatus Acidoferrum sp.]|nr:cytochrome c [Candidatus Acidoferrum sp.]
MRGHQSRILALVFSTLALVFLASASGTRGADDQTVKLFRTKCAVCHGDDGRGSDIGKSLDVVDLHSPEVQEQTDAQLIDAVTNGKGKMPPNKGRVTAAQIKSLVAYVRELGKEK